MNEVEKNKKYRILEILNNNFSKQKGKELKKEIIDKLCISERLFNSWLYLKHEGSLEISYINLVKLAAILKVEIDGIVNFEIKI